MLKILLLVALFSESAMALTNNQVKQCGQTDLYLVSRIQTERQILLAQSTLATEAYLLLEDAAYVRAFREFPTAIRKISGCQQLNTYLREKYYREMNDVVRTQGGTSMEDMNSYVVLESRAAYLQQKSTLVKILYDMGFRNASQTIDYKHAGLRAFLFGADSKLNIEGSGELYKSLVEKFRLRKTKSFGETRTLKRNSLVSAEDLEAAIVAAHRLSLTTEIKTLQRRP